LLQGDMVEDTLAGMEVFDATGPFLDGGLAGAKRALAAGRLVVVPTDTVYGVAARPDVEGATAKLFAAKRRPRDLTLPVLAPDRPAAESVAVFDDRARILAEHFWPGGVTLILPREEPVLAWDLGERSDTVGVRVPAHAVALALLERTGPLAVTSANVSGRPTPPDCDGVRAELADAVAVYLCAGSCAGSPSTVVDLTGHELGISREGAVPAADIRAALSP
jgi:L-threonylcarbamoyladenylate synthase